MGKSLSPQGRQVELKTATFSAEVGRATGGVLSKSPALSGVEHLQLVAPSGCFVVDREIDRSVYFFPTNCRSTVFGSAPTIVLFIFGKTSSIVSRYRRVDVSSGALAYS
jgi:hypothetical protein